MLLTLAGSAALDAVINKSLNPTSPLLYPCHSSVCSAGQKGLAETRDIPTPQSGASSSRCAQASIQTQSTQGEGKVQLAVLIYSGGGFLLGSRDMQYLE